jgi:Alpha-kinase family
MVLWGCPALSSAGQPDPSLLMYRHFLATPLLPRGEADPEILKFTGNDEIRDAGNRLTQAIHAFAHFSVVYPDRNLLFCDLQDEVSFLLQTIQLQQVF